MTDLPAPLTPADCDLRGYDFMPLFGHRLFNSMFDVKASDAEFRAAMNLWWSAWQQCPAASLPDDEDALCRLAGLGKDLRKWRKVAARSLQNFCKCADNRLYHPILAQEAIEAFERRRRERVRKANSRKNKETTPLCPVGQDADKARDTTRTDCGQGAGHPPDVQGTGQDRTEERKGRRKSAPYGRDAGQASVERPATG